MTATERRIPPWLLPAGLGVLVIALVIIALTRGPISLNPDSPEGTVQEYLLAISDDRWDDAVAVIHDDWRGSCSGFDLEQFAPGDFSADLGSPDGFGGFEVRDQFGAIPQEAFPEATIPDNATRVDVTIHHQGGGGLSSSWQEFVTFDVAFDGDFWWILGDPWPYFVFSCPGR